MAYRLGMKFYVFNEVEAFRRDVMDHFVAEYCAGHTPNPCIDCNRCLKFGALLDRAVTLGYDYTMPGSPMIRRRSAIACCGARIAARIRAMCCTS